MRDGQQSANEALHAALLASGTLDSGSLLERRRDPDLATTLTWIEQQGARLLAVTTPGGPVYPSFQFTEDGELVPELAEHVRTLQDAGLGPWQTWAWMTTPATLLSGNVPATALATEPERVSNAVRRMAQRVRGPSGRARENAEIDERIRARVAAMDLKRELANDGITTVSLDEDGRMVEHQPDGTATVIDDT